MVGLTAFILIISVGTTDLAISVANPLVMSDKLTKADAIVILGGPFFKPRFDYTVELYRLGYADKLLVMCMDKESARFFAQRYSIPLEAIFPVSRPQSTYDEALITQGFFKERHWKKGILISMPYHMLRAGKTFEKQGLAVCLAPVPEHQWYHYPLGSNFTGKFWRRQMWFRDIIHEYVGLLYYYLKDYM